MNSDALKKQSAKLGDKLLAVTMAAKEDLTKNVGPLMANAVITESMNYSFASTLFYMIHGDNANTPEVAHRAIASMKRFRDLADAIIREEGGDPIRLMVANKEDFDGRKM